MKQANLVSIISQAPEHGIIRLATAFGYKTTERTSSRGVVLVNSNGDQLLVPTKRNLRGYPESILEILRHLKPKSLRIGDMVSMLALPICDVYRHHFKDDRSRYGSFPLSDFPTVASSLFEMIKFTAAGVATGRRNYTRVPSDADVFAKSCQIGQTEIQSYVIKVFCPVSPKTQEIQTIPSEPYGRMVTQAFLENFDFLSSENSLLESETFPATLNKNVLSSISRLKSQIFTPSGEASVWFNPSVLSSDAKSAADPVQLSENTFKHAAILAGRFLPADDNEVKSFRGYIVDLHKDRPERRKTLTHEITMEIESGGGWRKLRVGLLPAQYRNAVRWHDNNQQVSIKALIDQRHVPWRTLEIDEMFSFDDKQGVLFPGSSSPPSQI